MSPIIAILIFLAVAAGLAVYGFRQLGRASQVLTMAIFSAAILFGIAALATLTFFNLGGHT
ncbi:MAG TPA: hypothetical protein VET65_07475 [Candidatus Limnocylindrales bacterium]|nr:hypothetical protein [Candidatus Limnocylindrales bacterium]